MKRIRDITNRKLFQNSMITIVANASFLLLKLPNCGLL